MSSCVRKEGIRGCNMELAAYNLLSVASNNRALLLMLSRLFTNRLLPTGGPPKGKTATGGASGEHVLMSSAPRLCPVTVILRETPLYISMSLCTSLTTDSARLGILAPPVLYKQKNPLSTFGCPSIDSFPLAFEQAGHVNFPPL